MNYLKNYPDAFITLRDELNFSSLHPWMIFDDESILMLSDGIKKRYPHLTLFPFAKRVDNDFTACFDENHRVIVFKDYAGREIDVTSSITLYDWLQIVMKEFIEYFKEEVDYEEFMKSKGNPKK